MPSGVYKHKPFSKEAKKNIGLPRKGKPFSGKHFSWKGKKLSEAHKNKIKIAGTGRVQSEATRRKLSETRKTNGVQ